MESVIRELGHEIISPQKCVKRTYYENKLLLTQAKTIEYRYKNKIRSVTSRPYTAIKNTYSLSIELDPSI